MENKCCVPFLLLSVWDLWALMQKEFISEPYTHWWFFVIPLVSNAIISFAFCCFVAVKSNSTTYTVQNLATYVLLFILHPFIVGMFLYCLRSRIYFLKSFWTLNIFFLLLAVSKLSASFLYCATSSWQGRLLAHARDYAAAAAIFQKVLESWYACESLQWTVTIPAYVCTCSWVHGLYFCKQTIIMVKTNIPLIKWLSSKYSFM